MEESGKMWKKLVPRGKNKDVSDFPGKMGTFPGSELSAPGESTHLQIYEKKFNSLIIWRFYICNPGGRRLFTNVNTPGAREKYSSFMH